ncbi:UNVERIFIED_CONTAM: putative pyrroloquinoline-quinone binding quinoprotein [Williamsia faeni]
MLRPERRTPLDIVIVVVLVVIVAASAVAIWATSSAQNTESDPAALAAAEPAEATSVPLAFTEAWRATSSATATPVAIGGVVVTGDGGAVVGHDPATGAALWSYTRDIPLCTVTGWSAGGRDYAIAIYRNSRGCSEVTALDAATGKRASSRSSDADNSLDISFDRDYVVAQGDTRLEAWRTDLVRTIEYGRVDAPVNPGTQPRSGCEFVSSGVGSSRIAVIERCGIEPGYRLTILGATLDNDEKLQEFASTIITGELGTPPRIVAVNQTGVTLYVSSPSPMLETYGADGTIKNRTTVLGDPIGIESKPITSGDVITFWTGKATVVIDPVTLEARFQVPETLGPGVVMAGSLLLPSATGISEHNLTNGQPIRSIPVERAGYNGGIITLADIGNQLVQQWDSTVSVLAPAQ